MGQFLKSSLVLASLLLMLIPLSSANTILSEDSQKLTSQIGDGIWVNETLTINGSTTLPPQNANWALYDVTDPYSEWIEVRSGGFFSEVIPVDEGLWIWSITIDVQNLNCTCWLEISQTDGLGKEFLNRIVFIGEGPHNPVISPNHETSLVIDGPEQISARAILADSESNESKLILTWCHAPHGACDGASHSSEINVTWEGGVGTFTIDATELGLYDGVWMFSYVLQDVFLRTSPQIALTVFVDQTDPSSVLISPDSAKEGELILIDGSGSSDGAWSNNLQSVWYVTDPDGITYVPTSNMTDEVLNIALNKSGDYTIRLDVIDWVGRMSSSNTSVTVENVPPEIDLELDGSDVKNPNSWQYMEDDELELIARTIETGSDATSLSYSWYLNEELVSQSMNITFTDLDVGTYDLRLVVVDDDGAEDTHEMQLVVNAKPESESGEFSLGALILILGIVVFSIGMFRRMRMSENEISSLPKWGKTSRDKSSNLESSENEENDLWNESNASLGGKD